MLLFFTATTMFSLVKFHSYRRDEFSPWWCIWLCTTGVSIGCVCRYIFLLPYLHSVKWVGVFGMAVVGLYTVEDLWNKLGDLEMDHVFHPMRMLTIVGVYTTLGSSYPRPYFSPVNRLYVFFLASFPNPLEFRSRRCSDVVTFPSQSQRL